VSHTTIVSKKSLIPRIVIPGVFVGLLAAIALGVSAGQAGAVTASKLDQRGWTCIAPLPVADELHCARDRAFARFTSGEAKVVTFLVFDPTGQEYLGTEVNVHNDVFRGQPCPTDPPTYEYTYLRPIFAPLGLDLPYWACHRFASDHL
jgi:hypothetical protein